MGTSYGARRIVVPIDGDYGDDFTDEDAEDWGEDDAVVVQYWVAESEEEDSIGLENSDEQLPLDVAARVAEAIDELLKWSRTKAGKKEIARLREKHEEWLRERLAKRSADTSCAAPKGGE